MFRFTKPRALPQFQSLTQPLASTPFPPEPSTMAMSVRFFVPDAHTRQITCMCLNPHRKEITIGTRDGKLRSFDSSSGKPRSKWNEHTGMVSSLIYNHFTKATMSAGIDGCIMTISSSSTIFDKLYLNMPIFSMDVSPRKRVVIVAFRTTIRVYMIDEWKESGHVLALNKPKLEYKHHTDMIRRVLCHELYVYTIGLDGTLVIYEFLSSVNQTAATTGYNLEGGDGLETGKSTVEDHRTLLPANAEAIHANQYGLRVVRVVHNAHNSGIVSIEICPTKTRWVSAADGGISSNPGRLASSAQSTCLEFPHVVLGILSHS